MIPSVCDIQGLAVVGQRHSRRLVEFRRTDFEFRQRRHLVQFVFRQSYSDVF